VKHQNTLKILIPLIGLLALFATGMGFLDRTPGESFEFTSHRGETVLINGQGLYFYDTVSMAAQQQGNDFVLLVVGLPFLAVSTVLALRGSLRARLLLTGTLGFFLYTYMSMAMLTSYNDLFLVYVVLFSLSLFAFILSMMAFDLEALPSRFADTLPRGWIAGLLFLVGGFLLIAWLGRIGQSLMQNQTPALENTTTLVIQAIDLGLVVPLCLLGGILLLHHNPWGYLLASVALLKGVTMGLAVSAMTVNMTIKGVPDSLGIMIPFGVITLLNILMAGLLLKNVQSDS
jgi:hypothetical protein